MLQPGATCTHAVHPGRISHCPSPHCTTSQHNALTPRRPPCTPRSKNLSATAQRTRDSLAKVSSSFTASLAGKLAGVDGGGLL